MNSTNSYRRIIQYWSRSLQQPFVQQIHSLAVLLLQQQDTIQAASRTSKAFRFLTTMSYMCMVLKLAKLCGKEMRSRVQELL